MIEETSLQKKKAKGQSLLTTIFPSKAESAIRQKVLQVTSFYSKSRFRYQQQLWQSVVIGAFVLGSVLCVPLGPSRTGHEVTQYSRVTPPTGFLQLASLPFLGVQVPVYKKPDDSLALAKPTSSETFAAATAPMMDFLMKERRERLFFMVVFWVGFNC